MNTRKTIGIALIAAMVGGIFSSGLSYWWFKSDNAQTLQIKHVNETPVKGAVYTTDDEGEIIPLDFTQVAKDVTPAVVNIRSTQLASSGPQLNAPNQLPMDDFFREFFGPRYDQPAPRGRQPQPRVGTGSGVIISDNGYIVTNNHVIRDADDIEVSLYDNRSFKARVIGTDPSTDLALIQIDETGLPYMPLSDSDDLRVGEWVMAVGNPFNLNSTVTAGIVSAKARNINILRDQAAIESFIQTDAAINPGNSGGALVNLNGGLVGINTAIASPTGAYAGYGFAVPSNIVEKVVEDLKLYGVVQRGYLGIMIRSLDGPLASEKGLDLTAGVYVDSLTANSSAQEAGLRSGDVIVSVDGEPVKTAPELQELVARRRPGDKVSVTVNRDGKEKAFEVVLKNRQGMTELVDKQNREVLSQLGAELEDLDEATAETLNISGGVRVTRLYAGLIRQHTQMREGFIITHVDGQVVKDLEAFMSIIENKKGGVMLEGVYENMPGSYYYAFGLK